MFRKSGITGKCLKRNNKTKNYDRILAVVFLFAEPRFCFVGRHTFDIFLFVGRVFSTVYIEEVFAVFGFKEALFIACLVAKAAKGLFSDKFRFFGIIFCLTDYFFHRFFELLII